MDRLNYYEASASQQGVGAGIAPIAFSPGLDNPLGFAA